MISRRLMRDILDVVYLDPGAADRGGTPTLTETSRVTVQGWMQMGETSELQPGEAGIIFWKLALNPTYLVGQVETVMVVPRGHDQIEYLGATYEIIGSPKQFRGIRKGTIHHYELVLKEVV